MTGIIALICFFCTALIEVINMFLYNLPATENLPDAVDITSLIIEYTLLSIALITSVKGLLYKDSTSKKLKLLYVVASVIWLTEKSFELYMGYLID